MVRIDSVSITNVYNTDQSYFSLYKNPEIHGCGKINDHAKECELIVRIMSI